MTNNDLSIDELALDREWLEQANKYLFHAARLANAKREADESKNMLEVVKADLYRTINSHPIDFGLTKPTVAAIEACVPLQQVYQDAQQKLVEAKHAVGMHDAMVEALQHRKRALENLVTLHITGYNSEPRAKREEDKEAIEDNELRAHYSKSAIQKKDLLDDPDNYDTRGKPAGGVL